MPYQINKPTRREVEERLAESRAKSPERGIEGVVRRTEEAYEIQRQRAREGHEFKLPYAVSGDAPESKLAEQEVLLRAGLDPDGYQPDRTQE